MPRAEAFIPLLTGLMPAVAGFGPANEGRADEFYAVSIGSGKTPGAGRKHHGSERLLGEGSTQIGSLAGTTKNVAVWTVLRESSALWFRRSLTPRTGCTCGRGEAGRPGGRRTVHAIL